jgi:hypothetical protein
VTPRRRLGVDWRDLGEEGVLYLDGAVHLLNSSAIALWRLLDGVRTDEDIVATLSAATGLPGCRVAADVERTLAAFAAAGLVDG